MSLPVQPWEKLLIDLGLPFRVTFDSPPPPEEREDLLMLDGSRTRDVISARYGLNGGPPLKQKELAARLGCTRQYVQQLEKRWRGKVKKKLGIAED
jgi:hypothetical protein